MKCEACESREQRRKFMEDKAGLSFLKTLPVIFIAIVLLETTVVAGFGTLALGWSIFKLIQIMEEKKFIYKKEE